MRSPSLSPFRIFGLDIHIPWTGASLLREIMLRPLPSIGIAYAAAAASLPPTATNHVTLLTY